MTKYNEYDKQAIKFLKDTNTNMTITYLGCYQYFDEDKENDVNRNIFQVELINTKGRYRFTFGDSVYNTQKKDLWGRPKVIKPTEYSILSCIGVGRNQSFKGFCCENGLSTDSFKAFNIYNKIMEEVEELSKIFNKYELDKLREIQ